MPALFLVVTILITAGATAAASYLLGPDASEERTRCVEAMTEALEPRTVAGVTSIAAQCRERYPE
jgi:hypothetical protein